MAGVLRAVYESDRYEVIGIAPTGRARRELKEEAGLAKTVTLKAQDMKLAAGGKLPDGCVLLVDEAGMCQTRQTARLLAAAKDAREGGRDRRQRPAPVRAGRRLAARHPSADARAAHPCRGAPPASATRPSAASSEPYTPGTPALGSRGPANKDARTTEKAGWTARSRNGTR